MEAEGFGRYRSRFCRATVALAAGFILVITLGCGEDEEPVGEGDGPLKVDAPLKALVWDPSAEVLFGLEQDGERLVKLDPERPTGFDPEGPAPDAVVDARELEGAGENLALDPRRPGKIYIPQPDLDQVYVAETDDLLEVRTFDAGVPPVRVALDQLFSEALYALSEDGSTVTRTELQGYDVVAEAPVDRTREALIEAPRGGEGAVWVAGPEGVALYGGASLERLGQLPLNAGGLAVDAADPERAYASEPESGRVVAVELGPRDRLEVVAEADVGEGARYLAAEEGRVYVATRGTVTVLNSENLAPIETIEFDPFLERTSLETGEPSALAVGEEGVYLALADAPYVLSLDKP